MQYVDSIVRLENVVLPAELLHLGDFVADHVEDQEKCYDTAAKEPDRLDGSLSEENHVFVQAKSWIKLKARGVGVVRLSTTYSSKQPPFRPRRDLLPRVVKKQLFDLVVNLWVLCVALELD